MPGHETLRRMSDQDSNSISGARPSATSQPRKWRVSSRSYVEASAKDEALDAAEQQLRASGVTGNIQIDVLSESTGETATRTVDL